MDRSFARRVAFRLLECDGYPWIAERRVNKNVGDAVGDNIEGLRIGKGP